MRFGGMIVGAMALVAGLGCGGGERGNQKSPEAIPGSVDSNVASAETLPTIIFLGTSLTAGFGIDPENAYPAVVQHLLDSAGYRFRVVNAGVSGETSAGTVRRIDWILRSPPAVLVIETGANDGLRGQDPDSLRQNLGTIVERTRMASPGTRIVLAGMEALPNMGAEYTRQFHAVYPLVARQYGLPLIPFLLAGVGGVDSLNQGDGIHPNERGAVLVAANVWKLLEPVAREIVRGAT